MPNDQIGIWKSAERQKKMFEKSFLSVGHICVLVNCVGGGPTEGEVLGQGTSLRVGWSYFRN